MGLMLWLVWACERQDVEPIEIPVETQRMVVTSDEIPRVTADLLNQLGVRSGTDRLSVNAGDGQIPFSIDWDHIMQLIEPDGREVYTFGMQVADDDPATFYNLVLKYSVNKEAYHPMVYKYTMSDDFLPQYLATGSLEGFRGSLQKILIKERTGGLRGSAALDDDGIVLGEPCPSQTSVGGDPNAGTPQDPDNPAITWDCQTYTKYTPWYTRVCDKSGCGAPTLIGYKTSLVTICGWTTDGTIEIENICEDKDGEVPIVDPEELAQSPCKLAKKLNSDSTFKEKVDSLKQLRSSRLEYGYILRSDGNGGYSYERKEGTIDKPEISFTISESEKIDGLLHSHTDDGLSIFTDQDFTTYYSLYAGDKMSNHFKFIFGVVAEGGIYIFRINNLTEFRDFGSSHFTTDGGLETFAFKWREANIILGNSIEDNEENLAKFLKKHGTGIVLLKGDPDNPEVWSTIKADSDGNIKRKTCD